MRRLRSFLLVALAACPLLAEEPNAPVLKESVGVSLVQLEVTVWPKNDDQPDACLGLTADDFELTVNGRSRPIYAVDALDQVEEIYAVAVPPTDAAAPGGLTLVLFFDLWHLEMLSGAGGPWPACKRTKPLAFAEARRFVNEQFHEGDRLLIVSSAGWPVLHEGWMRTRTDALAALSRLEKSRRMTLPWNHSHHKDWLAGMESLFLALGNYPGRKDVLYLGDDFAIDEVSMKITEYAGRAQSNGVVVSAVDLLDTCRSIPGWGPLCMGMSDGGLGCMKWRFPVGLSAISGDTGGQLFRTDRIVDAVASLRASRRCRYVVSFSRETGDAKRPPRLNVTLSRRRDLSLRAPSSFESTASAPTEKERNEALFLLPRFGRGVEVAATLWPYRPEEGKRKRKKTRWNALVLARVERSSDEPLPDELTQLQIDVLVRRDSKIFGKFHKTMAGEDLAAFRRQGSSRLLLFPAQGVQAGAATVDVTIVGNAEGVSANISQSFEVPLAPTPGVVRPWFLSDHLARLGDSAVMAPSLDNVVTDGESVSFLGFGCRAGKDRQPPGAGKLISQDGASEILVPLSWLPEAGAEDDGCGWLAGSPSSPLAGGVWTFQPPGDAGAALEFTVAGQQATRPAD